MAAVEVDVGVGDRVIRVRDAGDRDGAAVVFFHGTPSSRLDLHLAEPLAQQRGVRLVSFDRPGYGSSTPGPFSSISVAGDVEVVAHSLGLDRFAAFGQSSGSRYALAAAAVLRDQVTCVGAAAGSLMPRLPDAMDDDEQVAYALLADDPAAAARLTASWFDPLLQLVHDCADDDAIVRWFEPGLPPADQELLHDPKTRAGAVANVRESLRQGSQGAGWDGVSYLTPSSFDLTDIRCPVFIWFGDQDDRLEDAAWLSEHVTDPRVVIWPGEGHLAYKQHIPEIFDALLTCPARRAER